MPIHSEEASDTEADVEDLFETKGVSGWKVTRFEATPKMSTYLVAFANGDFQYLEGAFTSPISGKTRPLRIYSM